MRKLFVLFPILAMLSACSEHTAATQPLDQKIVKAGVMATAWPKTIPANASFIVKTVVDNASDITLPALGKADGSLQVEVSYHWRSMDEKVVVWDGVSSPLTADLKKDDTQKVDLAVKAPPTPGKYILEIDLVQNSAFWFAGAGSQVARVTVDVN